MQTVIVGVIIAGAVLFMILRILNSRKGGCGCGQECGCTGQESCSPKEKLDK